VVSFSHGHHTHSIPMLLHQQNRERLCNRLKSKEVAGGAIVLLEGGRSSDIQRYSTDTDHSPFRQVRANGVASLVKVNVCDMRS
jgi:hypothetical protein